MGGIFGYEFLARHFGATLSADRDLSIPDGWFGRPSTVLHIQEGSISIESTLPERESEIAKLMENSSLAAPQNFLADNRRCNLSFEEYEKIFTRHGKPSSMEKPIRSKFPAQL